MKCHIFEWHIYFYFIAFVLTLKLDGIDSFDDIAKREFGQIFFNEFPNPNYNHNTILPPFSFRGSLLAASFVAKRKTQAELHSLLYNLKPERFLKNLDQLKDENGWRIQLFVNKDMDVSVCVKNKTLEFIQYIELNGKNAVTKINDWVKKTSNEIVPGIWTHSSTFKKKSSFVTAVHVQYLDALWEKPFVNIIKKRANVNGIELRGRMLHQDDSFLYGNISSLGFEAIVFPLTEGAKMLVLQPYDALNVKDNFEPIRKKLQEKNIFNTIIKKLKPKKLSVYFPVLKEVKMERSTGVTASQNLNIKSPFENEADFGKLHSCGEDVKIQTISIKSSLSTDLASIQIATATDVNFVLADVTSTIYKYSAEFEEESEEAESEVENENENENQIYMEPDETLQKLVLSRFFFAIIQEDTPKFLGSIVKYHNSVNPFS